MAGESPFAGSIPMGHVSAFLLKVNGGYLLIDTGMPGSCGKITEKMKAMGAEFSEIKYIFITHHHIDHVGSLQDIREKTGAKLILHKNSLAYLERGISVIGKPVHLIAAIMSKIYSMFGSSGYTPVVPGKDDIIIRDDNDNILREMGIEGKILCTPGHTDDSISILLDDGTIFAGDAPNPLFVDNGDDLEKTLKKMVESGAKQVIPSHGPPYDVESIRKEIENAAGLNRK